MLNKIVQGRLGNQMFQYATMRAIQEKMKNDEKINFNFTQVRRVGKKEDGFDNQLKDFSLNYDKIDFDKNIKLNLLQYIVFGIYFVIYKILKLVINNNRYELVKQKFEKNFQPIFNKCGLYLYNYGFYDFKIAKTKNKLFTGYYESSKYFNNIKQKIFDEFTPAHKKLEKNKELYEIIENTNSVCVSIRRGDFLKKNNITDCLVCDEKYFDKAILEIQNRVENPQFVIFSDDIEWVKKNMKFPNKAVYEDGTDPVWEKLRLMYSCKNFIISNSTFSWWTQYLSRNENKIVVAPSKWRNINKDINKEIYEDNWIIIDV